ncbi:S8 family serine peptidase [Sorangium cellulosum]|uniref:S8 family serine peptidase n=1 Tax=Sorangium cellulosum TaxID=56 RepID=UPI001011BD0A|nr:S8 family serine peptidase [Sorangium cellulosum]
MLARRLPLALALLGLALTTVDARADAPASAMARLLRPRLGRHPLADPRGRIPVLVPLPARADARSLGLLPVAPGFGTVRLAPEDVDAFAAEHPELALLTGPPRLPLLDRSRRWIRLDQYREATSADGVGADGEGVVVGIVDTGIDVTHPDFRDEDGGTRIRWLLQAGEARGLQPALERAYGCDDPNQSSCAIFSHVEIDAMLAEKLPGLQRDITGHGTHVASIAAGNGGPMVSQRPRYVGVAPAATLIVAAPSRPGDGFDDPDILKAVQFIFDRADELGMPAVVNLSVGSDFGPHDGTSPLEVGLAAMVGGERRGRAIVVAAGNSGALYEIDGEGPMGIHTEAHVSPHAVTRVPIRTPASSNGYGYVWITFRPDDEVSVGLEGPGGEAWIGLVDPGEDAGYKGDDGRTTGAVINRLANGKSAITADTNSAVVAFSGAWEAGEFAVLLQGRGDAQLWVTGLGDVSPSHDLGLQFTRGIKQGTINVPASHPGLLAVGCTINRVSWRPHGRRTNVRLTSVEGELIEEDSACYFSAAGPTPFGVAKPEISAPGGFVVAAMGDGVDPRDRPGGLFDTPGCPDDEPCFVVDDHHAVASGSSMSAPQVTGAIALLFQRDPRLSQADVTEILQAGARYPRGAVPLDAQLGPGVLDLEGALLAHWRHQTEGSEPAIDRSWYVLSSTYARPDPSWPVWGTVELRRSDGAPVGGAGDKLTLSLRGGVVHTPLRQVRRGLWRFAVAAPRGSGGATLSVDVLYDGVSLGARELPIGSDVWMASGELEATSGACSCAAPGSVRGLPPGVAASWVVSGLAAAAVARRRRG